MVVLGRTGDTRLVLIIFILHISGPNYENLLEQLTTVPMQICSALSLQRIKSVRGAETVGKTEQTGVTRSDSCYPVGDKNPYFIHF